MSPGPEPGKAENLGKGERREDTGEVVWKRGKRVLSSGLKGPWPYCWPGPPDLHSDVS